jgi:hypothetical protein
MKHNRSFMGADMAQDRDYVAIAEAIQAAISDTHKKSRQIMLKTLIKQFWYKTRQKHFLEVIHNTLSEAGILIRPDVRTVEREDWVRLTVTDPTLPV